MAQSRKVDLNGWNEYKLLVLKELERLTQATEKLRDESIQCKQEVSDEIGKLRDGIHQRITDETKQLIKTSNKEIVGLKNEINDLGKRFNAYKKDQQKDTTTTNKWGFWAAIISIIGSLIVAVISLIIALQR